MAKKMKPDAITLSVDLLRADPRNAREITAEAGAGLGVSMETFGDLSGIVWNEQTSELVAGHQRMAQLRAAGATTWRRIDKDWGEITHPKTGEVFRIRVVEWDPIRQRMANLTANNTEIQGTFTDDALEQLRELEAEAGFEALKLDSLVAELDEEIEDGADDGDTKGKRDPKIKVTYAVIVECESEEEQARLLTWLIDEGHTARALI